MTSNEPLPTPNPSELSAESLRGPVLEALRHWHQDDGGAPFAHLMIYQQLRATTESNAHSATNQLLLQALQLLEEEHEKDATLLRRAYLDNELDEQIALDLNIGLSSFYRHTKRARGFLAEVLYNLEQQTRITARNRMTARLDAPTAINLVGIDAHLDRLAALLSDEGPPYIVTLAGIGGIGKTTLADATVRRLIAQDRIPALGWVTAQQRAFQWQGPPADVPDAPISFEAIAEALVAQLTGATGQLGPDAPHDAVALLHQQLHDQPHLIVIDNLETLPDIEAVVNALRGLAVPTKFLLTTRESLFDQPDVHHYAVPELSEAHALALIRQEAVQRNVPLLQEADEAELLPIVEAVGGNPLALRLVVGQTVVHPLGLVLENLAQARVASVEHLYDYIYRQAWAELDEVTRLVLLTMPLVPPAGVGADHLMAVSEIEESDLFQALARLVRLNLVEGRGNLHHRRYTIHNLTRTFLHKQVLAWQSS